MGKKRKLIDLAHRLDLEGALTKENMNLVFENHSKEMMLPLTWTEFCSHLNLTEEEVEENCEERLLKLFKQKCKASILASLKKNHQTLLRYYELHYEKGETETDFNRWERR
jgi:deoxyribodipyrimidine photolyase